MSEPRSPHPDASDEGREPTQRLTGTVTSRTWGLLASLGLLSFGLAGLTFRPWGESVAWLDIVVLVLGIGGIIDFAFRSSQS